MFNYHRFWAEVEVATAFQSFAYLFPSVTPPASATPTVTVTNPGTQTGTVGTADDVQIQASDSATGKTFTYSATDLPLGLSISSSTGAITGSPTMAGSYTTTVTVNDGTSASSVNFDWTIGASGTGTEHGHGDQPRRADRHGRHGGVSLQIQATDSATGQTLTYARHRPAGRAVDQLLHRPDHRHPDHGGQLQRHRDRHRRHRGVWDGVVHLDDLRHDGQYRHGDQPRRADRQGRHGGVAADPGDGLRFRADADLLGYRPAGWPVDQLSTGLITGTPTTAGTSSVVVTVKDGTGASGTASFSWTISTATTNTVTVTNPGSQTGTVGTAASLQIQATDSASGQTLTYSATGLPAGLSISSTTGLITGTPTTAGTSSVTVTATDTTGASGSATFSWTISAASGGSSCQVLYTPDDWSGGFTGNIQINNTGTSTINGWTLKFTFPGDEKITNTWNGVESQSGEAVTITNESYNNTIAAGGNVTLGFQGTWTNSDAAPTAFTVNGATCTT